MNIKISRELKDKLTFENTKDNHLVDLDEEDEEHL